MGKLKKEKHNHKLTDLLKVAIFSIVMMAPFISIGSKMAYVTFNKNAYESYYGETINEYTNSYISNNALTTDKTYYISSSPYQQSIQFFIQVDNLLDLNTNTNYGNAEMRIYSNANNEVTLQIVNSSEGLSYQKNINNIAEFSFDFLQYNVTNNFGTYDLFYLRIYNNYSFLDNVFEYAVDQLGTTPVFAWTKNTAIYTPIETMTNGLGFDPDNNTLAILLTYWTLVTAVYVIMDIVLFCFTKLTHFTQD